LVAPDDIAALAHAIDSCLSDPASARAMGHAARERILRECSWAQAADRIAQAIAARI
jgi:glycosyltransferase involved in cell wall biosynthesis